MAKADKSIGLACDAIKSPNAIRPNIAAQVTAHAVLDLGLPVGTFICRLTIKITDERRAQGPDAQRLSDVLTNLRLINWGAHSVHCLVR